MFEPTGSQIREFWEWCGLKRGKKGVNKDYYKNPNDKYYVIPAWELDIDLKNLFLYAVPKIREKNEIQITLPPGKPRAIVKIGHNNPHDMESLGDALYWAIWEVIKCSDSA